MENYFSIIRSKNNFPTFLEYLRIANRSYIEMVKRYNEGDFLLKLPRNVSKCYNGTEALSFRPQDLENLVKRKVKQKSISVELTKNTKCAIEEIVRKLKPSRNILNLRASKCKISQENFIGINLKFCLQFNNFF